MGGQTDGLIYSLYPFSLFRHVQLNQSNKQFAFSTLFGPMNAGELFFPIKNSTIGWFYPSANLAVLVRQSVHNIFA